jgi:odorant receptor
MNFSIFDYFKFFFFILQVGVDSLFFGLCLNICAQFDILRESFDGDKKKFIENHLKLLDLVKELNRFYKPIVFAQYFISSMLLCVIGFQILMHANYLDRVEDLMFGVAIIIQLFIYSYGGQLIVDKSLSVADGFYELEKDFILIIQRAQKQSIIEAGFYKASLPLFTSIMNSAASLITLLKSLLE